MTIKDEQLDEYRSVVIIKPSKMTSQLCWRMIEGNNDMFPIE